MERKDDPTIQKLFTLAKDTFGTDVQKCEKCSWCFGTKARQEQLVKDGKQQGRYVAFAALTRALKVSKNTSAAFVSQSYERDVEVLTEGVKNPKTRKRTVKILEDGLLFVDEMRKKHNLPVIEASSSATPTPSPGEDDLLPILQHEDANWRFVDAWKRDAETMD